MLPVDQCKAQLAFLLMHGVVSMASGSPLSGVFDVGVDEKGGPLFNPNMDMKKPEKKIPSTAAKATRCSVNIAR